jgi:Ca2+-binding EF-hand superfamily protein
MQVTLVDFEGVPAESIISIRAGGERRQAAVKQNHPFKFPSALKDANPLRIDIFSPLGSRLLSLDPSRARHTVDVGGSMKVVLDVQQQLGDSSTMPAAGQKVPSIPGFKSKLGQASEFNSYLERHNIVNFIQEIFLEMLHKMPDDPYSFLGGKLEGARIQLNADTKLLQGELRIDELLDFMKEDKNEIKKQFGRASVCPDLPVDLQQLMKDDEFRIQCNAKFDSLDTDGNGSLSAIELFPCIVEISQEHPYSVTLDHCERLLKIFDEGNTGNLTRDEFFEFVKFLYLMQYLDSQVAGPVQPSAPGSDPFDDEMMEAELRVDELLDMMAQDRTVVRKQIGRASQCPDMPVELSELMASDEFKTRCNEQFDQLDEDKNGVLTVDELFPILDDLSQEHPMAITLEHCQSFLKIFDDSNSGNLTRAEFYEFVKFMYLMKWLEDCVEAPQKKPKSDAIYDSAYDVDAIEGEYRIHDLLEMMKADKAAVKKEFGRASCCPDIPVELSEMMASEDFKAQCNSQFDALDADKNGVLTIDELAPVIVEISKEREQSVTLEHCQRFVEIFDEGKSGNLTRTEFYDFVKFMYFMLWLESASQPPAGPPAFQEGEFGVDYDVEGEFRIHDLLDNMKEDKAFVKKQFGRASACPDIPAGLSELLASEDFKAQCDAQFDALDTDLNGVLSADELFPVILEISQERSQSVTMEHCQRFLEMFDEGKSGNLTRSEFFDFVKFLYFMLWLDAASQGQIMDESAAVADGELRINSLLSMMKEDRSLIKTEIGRASLCPDMPPDLLELMHSEDFKKACEQEFDALDKDKNEVLSADELFPVIVNFSQEHPMSVTYEHCQRFLETFDDSKSGNLTRTEFVEFVKFLYLMRWLDSAAQQNVDLELIEGEMQIDDLLEMMKQDKAEVKRQFGRASLCPDLPPELTEMMASEDFKKEVQAKFDLLDADGNGVLTADELFPVIEELSTQRPLSVTYDHCMKLLAIFDDSKSGNLTRDEFFEFVKFLFLMQYLDSKAAAIQEQFDIIEGELRVDDLLDMMQQDRTQVRKQFGRASLCPDIPAELQEFMGSDEFKKKCEDRFDALDENKDGTLSADELYPVLIEISQETPMSITFEHCVRFMEMFDDSKSGNLTRTEFYEFAKFMYLMMWMDSVRQEKEMNDIVDGELKIDELLDMMQHNKHVVRQQFGRASACPDLPPQLTELMAGDEFKQRCDAQFDQLDEDKNGTLSADELFPIIIGMTSADPVHPYSVTYEHCWRLLKIFDDTNSGSLTKTEFYDFVKFMYLMSYLEAQQNSRAAEDSEMHIGMMLAMLDEGVSQIRSNLDRILSCPDIPEWLLFIMQDDAFVQDCSDQFDELDADKNGVLTPDELYPVIVGLSAAHPLAVTTDHCRYLSVIFDEDCNGVISRSEFVKLVRFIFIVQWLKEQPRPPPPPPQDSTAIVDHMLSILQDNVSAIKQEYATILSSPECPDWLKKCLQSEDFQAECAQYFDKFDDDGNGVLSPDELFPIVQEISQVHPVNITEEHCNKMALIFDEDKNGVISRDEFANLVKFVIIIQWLQEHQEQKAAASPEDDVQLEATNKQLLETQKTLQAVQEQLMNTTATMSAMLAAGANPGSPVTSNERVEWEMEKKKLMDQLAQSKQLQELQKKGMAQTVGQLMVEKQELEMQLEMAKIQK